MLRLKLVVTVAFACAAIGLVYGSQSVQALSRGPFLERSNAPGEANCTQCHRTYPLDSGHGKVEILGLPAQYEPSHVYPIVVRVTDPGAREWGFQITSITDDGSASGFFQTETLAVQALGPSQKLGRFYAEHTIFGVYAGQLGSAEWQMNWKAPSTDLGPAHFYAVGNAANGDHTDFYDYIYSTELTIDGLTKNVRVTLLDPAPGASARLGSGERADIRWTATDGDAAVPASFRIALSTDGGETYPTVLASDLPASARSFAWQIPEALVTPKARIRIIGVDTGGVEHVDQSRTDLSIGPLGLDRATTAITLPRGAAATAGAWADFDADGRADVAISRSAGGTLLLTQQSDGSFVDVSASSGVSGFGESTAVAWGDANADGFPDLAVAGPSMLAIYVNDGKGRFELVGAPTSLPRPTDPRATAWADVDGDGRSDVLVASTEGLIALRNSPSGFVDVSGSWGAPSAEVDAISVGSAIAIGGPDGASVLRFERGRLEASAFDGHAVGAVRSLLWADVSGDGTLDLLVGSSTGLHLFAGAGGGARLNDATAMLGLSGLSDVSSIAAGDFDADGDLDLFVIAGGTARVARNGGATGFDDVTGRFAFDQDTQSAAWVDVDSSGAVDLVAVSPTQAVEFTNPRSGSTAARLRLPQGSIVQVDLDGDVDWQTGPKSAHVVDGIAEVIANVPSATAALVRVEFPGRGGRQVSVSVGAAATGLDAPDAPTVTAVRASGAKLVVDGLSLPASSSIEVGDTALERVKAPTRYRNPDGTSQRLVGRDAALPALLSGGPTVVRIVDQATGIFTAPYFLP